MSKLPLASNRYASMQIAIGWLAIIIYHNGLLYVIRWYHFATAICYQQLKGRFRCVIQSLK